MLVADRTFLMTILDGQDNPVRGYFSSRCSLLHHRVILFVTKCFCEFIVNILLEDKWNFFAHYLTGRNLNT